MPGKRPHTKRQIADTASVDFYIALSQKNDGKRFWVSAGCKKLRQMTYKKQRNLAESQNAQM